MSRNRLLAQSVRAMTRYKLRTFFMMLGSLVGVAALTFIMPLGQSAKAKMLTTVRQIVGDASIIVAGGGGRMMGSHRPAAGRLTIDDIAAVVKDVPDIEVWDPQAELSSETVRYGDATASARVLGGSERWERAWGRGVSRGESFDVSAVASTARVALIGASVRRALFGDEDATGAEIRIGAVPFRVLGVLETFGSDMHGMDRDNEIVVPITTLMRRLTNTDAISTAKLVVRDPALQEGAAQAVRNGLRARHALNPDQPDDFTIVTSLEAQKMVRMVERVLIVYLPLVGAIALIVGGVVAATLMLASVNERIAEIGLRRAVGARPEDIGRQFILETTATIVVGAVAGVAVGTIAAQLVARRFLLDGAFSWTALLVSLLAATITGLAAGVAPARRAARMNPVDALR